MDAAVRQLHDDGSLCHGFDRFFYSDWHKPFIGSHITTSAIEFMASHRDEPFFCFLHYYDPHPPFGTLSYLSDVKASPMRWEFPGMLYNYWKKHQERVDLVGDLAHLSDVKTSQLDLWLNSLFAYLETSGLIENTTVFLTSDHGREYYKGVPLLTQDRVAVPLLVRDPDRHAEVAEEFVEPGVDLYPTILKLAGLETPEHAVGHDLLASKRHRREFALSESLFNGVYEIVLRNDSWCYAFKCRMDPRSGEIHTDDQIAEFLYERADDLQNRYDGTDRRADHQDAGAAFRAEVEAFCHETERYFDDSSLLDRSS
jgi:arylsulfatase A-like enzyme